MSTGGALTSARIRALRREMLDVESEVKDICGGFYGPYSTPRHLLEAAKEVEGFAEVAYTGLSRLARALSREERPVEEKVRELEHALDRLEHPVPDASPEDLR